jgi:hypothetical protein
MRQRGGLGHPVFWPAFGLLGLYAASYALFAAQLISFPFDLDQGEGYDAWSAWLVNLGQLPYTTNAAFPYYSHGYPPVWSYVVSVPMAWTGPGLAPARAVSVLAALGAAALVGLAARRLGRSDWAGLLAAGLFLASPYVFHTTPLARVNGLVLLLDLAALTLLEVPTPRRVLAGTLVLVAAVFTKPTALDAAVAGLLSVLLARPRLGAGAVALFGLLSGTALAALQLASGGTYLANVLASNASAFDPQQLRDYLVNVGTLHAVVLLLAAGDLAAALAARRLSVWHLYFVVAAATAVATVGKTGAGESYFLQTIAVGCILAAARAQRLLASVRGRPALLGSLAAALGIQGLLLAHGPLSDAVPWLPDRGLHAASLGRGPSEADRQAGAELAALARATPNPILAEDGSLAVAAGKPIVGTSPPSLRNLYQAGLWDPAPLVADVRAHRYGLVVLDAQLYPEPVLAAIGQSYFLQRTVQMHTAVYRVFLPGAR